MTALSLDSRRPGYRFRLHHLISDSAERRGEAVALIAKEAMLTYAELTDEVARFGSAMRSAGLCRGDRVAVYLEKRLETVAATFGSAAAGGVFVPVNPLLRPGQVGHILRDSGARFLVTSADRARALEEEIARSPNLEMTVLVNGAGAASRSGTVAYEDFIVDAAMADPPQGTDLDVAAIFYTSGSTGLPKGVVLSHRNLIAGAESVVEYLGNHDGDRILGVLPLSFDAGFSQLTTAFAAGAQVVLHDYLLPGDAIRLCAAHRITGITGVPPLWVQLAEQKWPAEATADLRYFASTGGRMPKSTLEGLRSALPDAEPFLMYGLTEAFRSTYLDPSEVDRRPDSIGKAIPNAEVTVVRPDGARCAPGERGELVHRGALVAMGYWNDPEGTAARFKPAPGDDDSLSVPELAVWSGDFAIEDEEGFLYFAGRADEMIKTSGYRVSPGEIERAVEETGLAREAVAFGLDDPRLGQAIALVVSPADVDRDALGDELSKRLPRYMLPKRLEVLAELPRSPNGKFDRVAIREGLTG